MIRQCEERYCDAMLLVKDLKSPEADATRPWRCSEHRSEGGPEQPPAADPSALSHQEGGDHYKKLAIQPAEYVHENKIPYLEGSVIYYVTRWRDKNGIADIDKAIHTLQLLKELELKRDQRTYHI